MSTEYEDSLEGFDLKPSMNLDEPLSLELMARASKLRHLIDKSKASKHVSPEDIVELDLLIKELGDRTNTSGFHKWYVEGGPFAIDKLPKHKAFFDATKDYREVLILGGNRTSKTTSGCYVSALTATGQYPDWWDGVRFNGPVNNWSVGATAKSVKETLQEALLGPPGALGTGLIPKDCIIKTDHKAGTPGAVNTVYVKHISGGTSTITFLSGDQKVRAFFGTARHIIHIDEPTEEDIYNECLIRTMTTNGRILHSITPKKGLTRMLANFLSDCELLAGTQSIKGLAQAKALMDMERARKDEEEN